MRRLLAILLSFTSLSLLAGAKPRVKLTTNLGAIVVELEPDAAPRTVENFLKYVKKGQYKGTIFHRVIPGFMIQGGGYVDYLGKKRTGTPDPNSAAAEFYINVVDNAALDFKSKANATTWGYCVFGKVVQGMDVVDRIKAVKTSAKRSDFPNLPVKPVLITDAAVLP